MSEPAIDWNDPDAVREFREKCPHSDVRIDDHGGSCCATCGALLQVVAEDEPA